jgi:membrane protease YdiL (CAAX protease family)
MERDKILVWFRLLLCYLLVAFAQIVGMGVVAPRLFGIDLSDPSTLSSESRLLMLFVSVLFATILIFLVRRFIDRKTIGSLGLLDKKWGKTLLTGFGLGGFTQVVVFILLLLFGGYRIDGYTCPISGLIIALLMASLVAWLEELEFRAYTIENLRMFGIYLPIIISSAIFVIPHYSGRGFDNPAIYVSIFIFGILTGLAYLKSGSIYLPLGFHMGFNFSSGILFEGVIIRGEIFSDLQHVIFEWIAFGVLTLLLINILREKKGIRS